MNKELEKLVDISLVEGYNGFINDPEKEVLSAGSFIFIGLTMLIAFGARSIHTC